MTQGKCQEPDTYASYGVTFRSTAKEGCGSWDPHRRLIFQKSQVALQVYLLGVDNNLKLDLDFFANCWVRIGRVNEKEFGLAAVDPLPRFCLLAPIHIFLLWKQNGGVFLRNVMLSIQLNAIIRVLEQRQVSQKRHLVLQVGHA